MLSALGVPVLKGLRRNSSTSSQFFVCQQDKAVPCLNLILVCSIAAGVCGVPMVTLVRNNLALAVFFLPKLSIGVKI